MIFNFAKFIVDNLCSGFDNKSFTEEQVNIYSMNYLMKGQITQEDFQYIQEYMNPTPIEEE